MAIDLIDHGAVQVNISAFSVTFSTHFLDVLDKSRVSLDIYEQIWLRERRWLFRLTESDLNIVDKGAFVSIITSTWLPFSFALEFGTVSCLVGGLATHSDFTARTIVDFLSVTRLRGFFARFNRFHVRIDGVADVDGHVVVGDVMHVCINFIGGLRFLGLWFLGLFLTDWLGLVVSTSDHDSIATSIVGSFADELSKVALVLDRVLLVVSFEWGYVILRL